MNNKDQYPVQFENVDFFYSDVATDPADPTASPAASEEVTQVFSGLSIDLPGGVLALVGENGIGKSTLLLLAGARLMPTTGTVTLFGRDTREFAAAHENPELEDERNRDVSFIYQNMEFETNQPIGDLMQAVYRMGNYETRDESFPAELYGVLELESVLAKQMQELSKGQLQRAIIAFSLLYGSKIIMMDEPVFALEEPQKERIFEYLLDYSHRGGTAIYFSAHNLELSKKYSDSAVLFRKNSEPVVGKSSELLTRENLEKAFQAPMDTLYRRDNLYREMLLESTRRKTDS